jgi:hypothetical protein
LFGIFEYNSRGHPQFILAELKAVSADAMTVTGKDRIMIFGPKDDGTYVVEFRMAEGEALAIPPT